MNGEIEIVRAPTQSALKDSLKYWEDRLQWPGLTEFDRMEAEKEAEFARQALQTGTFPETPDSHSGGIVGDDSLQENTRKPGRQHFHEAADGGNVAQDEAQQEVEREIEALREQRRGNVPSRPNYAPGAIDDYVRGRLVSLLGLGLSIRQAAAAVGVSHTAVRQEIKRNAQLTMQVELAREQARLEPLLVIIRESKRSWRAASWLMKHLEGKRSGRKK